jgi:hypothetical protein
LKMKATGTSNQDCAKSMKIEDISSHICALFELFLRYLM